MKYWSAQAELVSIATTFPSLALVMEGKQGPSPEGPASCSARGKLALVRWCGTQRGVLIGYNRGPKTGSNRAQNTANMLGDLFFLVV